MITIATKEANEILKYIRNYKEFKADIKEIDIAIKDIQNIELKEKLIKKQQICNNGVERIENAMSILMDEEKEVIETIFINKKSYYLIQDKLNFSYQRIKQLEKQAAGKMEKYIFPKY